MVPVIRRNPSLTAREVGGELLLLDTESNQIHQLNGTASFIWRLCDEDAVPEAIASALSDEFAVDQATALKDVQETLAQMRSLNLLAAD